MLVLGTGSHNKIIMQFNGGKIVNLYLYHYFIDIQGASRLLGNESQSNTSCLHHTCSAWRGMLIRRTHGLCMCARFAFGLCTH